MVIVVPWYFFGIPIIVFIIWVWGIVFILNQLKQTLKFQRRSFAAKKGYLKRKRKRKKK